jgi:acetyl esterase/lipase
MPRAELDVVVSNILASVVDGTPTLAEQRTGYEAFASATPMPGDVRTEKVDAGGVPAEWVSTPGAVEDRVILYFHGGGYVIGSPVTHRSFVSHLARAAQARALLLDYRLAPENPFPAAVDDAVAAYRWLIGNVTTPERVVFAGDSAGGGLTICALLAVRDAGLPAPAGAVAMSPWGDLAHTGGSIKGNRERDPMVALELLEGMAAQYLGGADPRTPTASPVYADFTGIPPMLIHVGTDEILLDDSVRITERARAAGCDVELHPWPDMIHVFPTFADMLPPTHEAWQAIAAQGDFVRARTA